MMLGPDYMSISGPTNRAASVNNDERYSAITGNDIPQACKVYSAVRIKS